MIALLWRAGVQVTQHFDGAGWSMLTGMLYNHKTIDWLGEAVLASIAFDF